jgi:hypothetical protein
VLSIEDPPERPVCSMHGPLKWGYFTDTKQGARWVSFTFEAGGVLVPHVCDNPDPTPIRWSPSEAVAETARRGRAFADAVLAEKAKERIEKESA